MSQPIRKTEAPDPADPATKLNKVVDNEALAEILQEIQETGTYVPRTNVPKETDDGQNQ